MLNMPTDNSKVKAYPLPHLKSDMMQFYNLVLAKEIRLNLTLLENNMLVCLQASVQKNSLDIDNRRFLIQFGHSSGTFLLAISTEVLQQQLLLITQNSSFDKLPQILLIALFETLFSPVLQAIEQQTGIRLKIEKIAADFKQNNTEYAVLDIFQLFATDRKVLTKQKIGFIQLDAGSRQLFLQFIEKMPDKANLLQNNIPVRLLLHIGSAQLSLQQLKELALDDIVFIDQLAIDAIEQQGLSILLCTQTGQKLLMGKLSERGLTIDSILNTTMNSQEHNRIAKENISHPNSNSLEMELNFILGEILLTVAELVNIKVDQFFPLPKLQDELVTIMINNLTVAKGRVVILNQRIGIKITEFIEQSLFETRD